MEFGKPFQPGGQTAWVAPARSDAGGDLVLKVAWRHTEAAHEADGLREWNGEGAAQLHATDEFDDTTALLLERCVPGTTLASRPEERALTLVRRVKALRSFALCPPRPSETCCCARTFTLRTCWRPSGIVARHR